MSNSRKASTQLTLREARLLFDGAFVAYCIGRPLNRFITIHWESAGVKANVHKVQTAFLHYWNDWFRYRLGFSSCYVWVLECPIEDGKSHGLHAHVLVNVPDDLWEDFLKLSPQWLEAAGARLTPRAILHLTLNGWKHGPWEQYLHWDFGLLHRLRYMAKGIDPAHAAHFGIEKPEPQGMVEGKRCGRSESLNPNRCVWPMLPCPSWSGISVAGRESRRLRFLRAQLPHVLVGVEDGLPSPFSKVVDLDPVTFGPELSVAAVKAALGNATPSQWSGTG